MTNDEEIDALWRTAERAQDRVQSYFASRGQHQHDIDGIKQLIGDATLGMIRALNGRPGAQNARNPVTYLASRIETISGSTQKQSEDHFALEILADELGIKDEVLKTLASRQGGATR